MVAKTENKTARKSPAKKPATQVPAVEVENAVTKYTTKNGEAINIESGESATVDTLINTTVDGKQPLVKYANGRFVADGKPKACKQGSYQQALLDSFSGRTLAEGLPLLLANGRGAVPPKYVQSYALVNEWLAGGTKPPASHIGNVARHCADYLRGWLLKPAHGAHKLDTSE